jgi:hypothetical protein
MTMMVFDGRLFCSYCGSLRVKTVIGDACCGNHRCKDCDNKFTISNDDIKDIKLLQVPEYGCEAG